MAVAVVGAVAALVGAAIGAVAATINARRSEVLQRELAERAAHAARQEQLATLALAMAKAEIDRNPASPHSVAAHFKVLEALLHEFDDPAKLVDLESVRIELDGQYAGLCKSVGVALGQLDVAEAIDRVYCEMCGSISSGPVCNLCGGAAVAGAGSAPSS